MQLDDAPRKPRIVDTSNKDARLAVVDLLERFSTWREDLARYAAQVKRDGTRAEIETILQRCDDIERDLMDARTELLNRLADAPQRVAGNSRVVDLERALDNTEASVNALRQQLMGPMPS